MTNHGAIDEPEQTSGEIPTELDATAMPTGDREALDVRAQRTFEQIADDAALTGDLTDDAAEVLLDWARGETQRLVAMTQEMEDSAAQAALAPKVHHLRRYLRRIARNSANKDNPTNTLHKLLEPPIYPEP